MTEYPIQLNRMALVNVDMQVAFVEGTPLPNKPVAPGSESLQLDIEFRFTDGGSVATYFNAAVTVIDTIQLPFEVW